MAERSSKILPAIITVAGLVALVVVLAAAVPAVLEYRRTRALQSTTTQAYAAALPDWDRTRAADSARLTAVLGPPRLRSQSVRCVLETDEAGLMVTSYQQVCSMRSVDVYATTEGFDQLARRLGTRPPTGQRTGECGLLRSSSGGRRELQVVLTRLQAGQFLAADEPGARNEPCAAPQPAYDGGAVRSGPTFDPAEIRPDRSWVTVVHEQQFLSQGLGCRGIVFCSSPVKASVLP